MKLGFSRLQTWLAVGLLVVLNSGCATPALWHATAAREWKPVSLDQVLLLTNTNHQRDVAVLFRQVGKKENDLKTRDVGWCVSQSPDQLALTPNAIHRLTNSFSAVQVVPLYHPGCVPANASSCPPGYAVGSLAADQLTIHIDGLPSDPFALPASRQTFYTLRICAMPIAVATDTTLFIMAALASGHWK